MRLRRTVAKFQVKQRRKRQEKIERETRSLSLQRNKALKEAKLKAQKAQVLEEARQAELKKLKADERLKLQKRAVRRKRVDKATKIGKGIVKTLIGMQRGLQRMRDGSPPPKPRGKRRTTSRK